MGNRHHRNRQLSPVGLSLAWFESEDGGLIVLVLGSTSDDKGAQLESLIFSVLERQGYQHIVKNRVGAGGNELDVTAERISPIPGGTQITPLMCEAKALAAPVDMPKWQRFLGKLLIERARDATTIGLLVALNGVNGNVSGSFQDLRRDPSLFVIGPEELQAEAEQVGQLAKRELVRQGVAEHFGRLPIRMEVAYYAGGFYWVVWWNETDYSVVDGNGQMLAVDTIEGLRAPLATQVSGALVATDEAQAEAEARHSGRMALMNRLFESEAIDVGSVSDEQREIFDELGAEPFCTIADNFLRLLGAEDLDAEGTSRLFMSMFGNVVRVRDLSFMAAHRHDPYVDRLVELFPDLQRGFALSETNANTLRAVARLFPSVWVRLAQPIAMISNHRSEADSEAIPGDVIDTMDTSSLWETVMEAAQADFSNAVLRGFLYDYMDVAEIQAQSEFRIKSKHGLVGDVITTEFRHAVRQFTDEAVEQDGPIYVLVNILPTIQEPWDDHHPDPEFPLHDDES